MNLGPHWFLPVAFNTLAIYLALVVLIRIFGRRQLGQLNVLDLLVILLLGSAVETALIGGDTSLKAGLICAATLLVANRALAELACKFPALRKWISPGPTLIVNRGRLLEPAMLRLGLTDADVLEAVRERLVDNIEQVRFAVVEADGEINVIPYVHKHKKTP